MSKQTKTPAPESAATPNETIAAHVTRVVGLPVTSRTYPPAYLRSIAEAFGRVGDGYALEIGVHPEEKTARQQANSVARLLQEGDYLPRRSVGTRVLPREDGQHAVYLVPRDPSRPERKKTDRKAS